MSDPSRERYLDADGGFSVLLPPGWSAEAERDEGGVEMWGPEEHGTLHLIGLPQPADEFPDPAEELYAFLHEQGVELEEDEVEDVELGEDAEMALCEYLAEDEEAPEESPTLWMIGVATSLGGLVFATYSAAEAAAEGERDAVRQILRSLRFEAPA